MTQTEGSTIAGMPVPPGGTPPRRREYLWSFAKRHDEPLSEHFSLREFHCGCTSGRCHHTLVHPKLVESLQTLRSMLAQPLVITSGYRCPAYNRTVGGRPRSFHTRGMAADVLCRDDTELAELARAAARIPAVGAIGRYPQRHFVHLDVRPREADGRITEWSG